MKTTRVLLAAAAVIAAVAGGTLLFSGDAQSGPDRPSNKILARTLDIERGVAKPEKYERAVSSGVVYTLLQKAGILDARADAAAGPLEHGAPPSTRRTQGCPNVFQAAAVNNIRVNQDCSLRRQAEEVVAVNPLDPRNIVAGQNDSRLGFNKCGYDWSLDRGRTWGDQVPPFYQYLQPDNHTADACSDPSMDFDADGNLYITGVLFNVANDASSIIVLKSNAPNKGTFYHTPHPLSFQEYRVDPPGIVARDNTPNVFHDKEFLVADDNAASPKKNNVYVTWTRFAVIDEEPGANSPIYFSQSEDGGATWSPGIEISGSNPAICTDFGQTPDRCDQDQGSHPIVGPDGTVYVVFGNGNTPEFGINQVLFVKCPAGSDCSQAASWTMPVKVGDLVGLHPIGPSDEGCPPGRQCLPPNGYRVPEFTSMTASVVISSNLYVSWSDFRNGFKPPCDTLDAQTSEPPCNNDVFYAYSTDGGATWSETRNITPISALGDTAQWQPWSDVWANGSRLEVAFYDRSYGNCEFEGCNDITLATIVNPRSATPTINYRRVTTASMPNLTPANNPVQAGFLGDYMWVEVDSESDTHIVWADTRGLNDTVEEDIYYARLGPRNPGN
jgi:hypothetical protein